MFVFLLSDLNREKSAENVLIGYPVFYGFAGNSLSMKTVRPISDWLVEKCRQKGINVLTRGCDGQMAPLAFYDSHRNPLTILHAQKICFSESQKLSPEVPVNKRAQNARASFCDTHFF